MLVDGTDKTVVRVAELALFPNRVQRRRLDHLLELVREAYNAGLQERRDAWRRAGHSVQLFDQFAQVSELRELRPEIKTCGIQPIRAALRRVDHAFAGFFRRCARGDKPGFPRFKNRRRYRSIDYDEPVSWSLQGLGSDHPRISVQGIGEIRLGNKGARQLARLVNKGGEPRTLRVVKLASGHGWHACVSFRHVAVEPLSQPGEAIAGIDRGIANTVALPDGTLHSMPRFLAEARTEIAELQRLRALTKSGSSDYRLLSRRIAKRHRKAKNQSIGWARHLAAELVATYGVIVIEKLELKNMTRSATGSVERPARTSPRSRASTDRCRKQPYPGWHTRSASRRKVLDAGYGPCRQRTQRESAQPAGTQRKATGPRRRCSPASPVATESMPMSTQPR